MGGVGDGHVSATDVEGTERIHTNSGQVRVEQVTVIDWSVAHFCSVGICRADDGSWLDFRATAAD